MEGSSKALINVTSQIAPFSIPIKGLPMGTGIIYLSYGEEVQISALYRRKRLIL